MNFFYEEEKNAADKGNIRVMSEEIAIKNTTNLENPVVLVVEDNEFNQKALEGLI